MFPQEWDSRTQFNPCILQKILQHQWWRSCHVDALWIQARHIHHTYLVCFTIFIDHTFCFLTDAEKSLKPVRSRAKPCYGVSEKGVTRFTRLAIGVIKASHLFTSVCGKFQKSFGKTEAFQAIVFRCRACLLFITFIKETFVYQRR